MLKAPRQFRVKIRYKNDREYVVERCKLFNGTCMHTVQYLHNPIVSLNPIENSLYPLPGESVE